MRNFVGVTVVLASVLALRAGPKGPASVQAPAPPAWAYGVQPAGTAPAGRGTPAPPDDGSAKHLADTTQAFTLAQLRDGFNIADWYPTDHPTAPDIVMKGKAPAVRACGLCHYPNGRGRPENSGVNSLPVAYFVQQMHDFKNDVRKSAESRKTNTNLMIQIAKGMTEEEIAASATYFAAIKPSTKWIKVVETAEVPATRLAGGMFIPLGDGGKEPIGARIIEVPEFPDRTELRDPRAGFIAYVPAGSVKRGEALVTTGGAGKTIACGTCHGADLNGLGPVPGLAGRSPSYMARQIFDMQAGARKGVWSDLMKQSVAKLTEDDIIAIVAYLASR